MHFPLETTDLSFLKVTGPRVSHQKADWTSMGAHPKRAIERENSDKYNQETEKKRGKNWWREAEGGVVRALNRFNRIWESFASASSRTFPPRHHYLFTRTRVLTDGLTQDKRQAREASEGGIVAATKGIASDYRFPHVSLAAWCDAAVKSFVFCSSMMIVLSYIACPLIR